MVIIFNSQPYRLSREVLVEIRDDGTGNQAGSTF
jgi:hypothetical protein